MDSNPPNPSSPPPPPSTTTTTTTTATATTTTTTSSSQIQSSLRSLNKSSYKISKPSSTTTTNNNNRPSPSPPPPPLPIPAEPTTAVTAADPNPSSSIAAAPPQPPVYNIDKNNFREIVQKLTGSISPVPPRPAAPAPPAAVSTPPIPPPPQPQPHPHPSRLHRIRPPPLANLSARPPSIALHQVLSPLPPLPSVGVTAESPISAYMRRLHGGTTMDAPPLPPPPLSPLGFGCLQSPRTAYQMMMMSSAGLPTSPGLPPLPALSPRGER